MSDKHFFLLLLSNLSNEPLVSLKTTTISEGSCDIKDLSNDAEKKTFAVQITWIIKWHKILNRQQLL